MSSKAAKRKALAKAKAEAERLANKRRRRRLVRRVSVVAVLILVGTFASIQWLVENDQFQLANRDDSRAISLFIEGANDLAFREAQLTPPVVQIRPAPSEDALDVRVTISALFSHAYNSSTDRFRLLVHGAVLGYYQADPKQFRVTDKLKPGFTKNMTFSSIGVKTPKGIYRPKRTSSLSLELPQRAFAPVQYTRYPEVRVEVDGKVVNPFPLPEDGKPDFVQAALVIRVKRPTIYRQTPFTHVGRVIWDPALATRSSLDANPELKLSLVFASSLDYSGVSPGLVKNEYGDLYGTGLLYNEEAVADFEWRNDDLSYVFAASNWITGAVLFVLLADFLISAVRKADE